MFVSRVKGQDVAFEPAKLLWLIQRDFLQGKSVQQMVNEALQRVPNDNGDKYIDEVNQIRDSLAVMGNNSTAFSLPQPHLQRTKLCDMEDKELEPLYVKRREQLKQLVSSIVKPKIVQGRTLNGKDFVSFLQQILEALNKGEIPSTGSLVEIFNKAILDRCLKVYREKMDGLGLPVPVDKLQKLHEMANGDARILFDKQHFGKHHAAQSALKLEDDIKKMLAKSRALFIKEYNNKLFNWLVTFSLVMVVIGRFVIKFFLLEIAAWVMFIFLETYTRMFWSAESLYYNPAWHIIVSSWETIVYSPILDLDR
uniref:Guanylate-binding protein/Atlastin C-terminal domain-containing protein n=1 Tax=Zea mays TaxID=4577 RepID=A0A804M5L0_MAIZE